ncbi:uncharacterized protein Dvir_GJ11400 [Drosophila virilis]|uniref:Reticulon-like protein n=2 Tax=Drosophila virilis TaxID=7244 RepID=B4LHW8_DROVI|nr:reticulon-1-A [Drosophila virilis]EDW70693.1 uncharacterized protein Dvir_GJ11400 [Drosophila virilis]
MELNERMHENIAASWKAWQALLLWHNWRKTALFFCLMLTLLLDMASNPVISVVSVAGAIAISISICYSCYVWAMRKLRKSSAVEHPLKRYLDMDVTISKETAEHLAYVLALKLNPILLRLRSLFLVEDLLDSLKLLMMLCGLNIVGDYVNGMTILVLAFVLLFTLPKLYEWKKKTINKKLQQLQLFKNQLLTPKCKINAVPTATVDPQFMETDLNQKANYMDNELDNNTGQFISYEQDSGQDYTSDHSWQTSDMNIEAFQHIKQS